MTGAPAPVDEWLVQWERDGGCCGQRDVVETVVRAKSAALAVEYTRESNSFEVRRVLGVRRK